MSKLISLRAAVKIYYARNGRDIPSTDLHNAYIRLMIESNHQLCIDNLHGMRAALLGKEMIRRRASRAYALLHKPSMPSIGRVLSAAGGTLNLT